MIARYHASTRVSCGGKQQREEETPSQVRAACTSMSFDEMRSTSHLARCPRAAGPSPARGLAGGARAVLSLLHITPCSVCMLRAVRTYGKR